MVILVSALKQLTGQTQTNINSTAELLELFTSRNMKMENFMIMFIGAHGVSMSMYFLIGGFLHVSSFRNNNEYFSILFVYFCFHISKS